MLRHTALFLWRDSTTDSEKLTAKKGLAYLSYGCPSVRAVDFGTDINGGSTRLNEVKPWDRTPLWNARSEGPPSNYDIALNLDFESQDELDEYNRDDVHHEVGAYNASKCRGEFTARVDWWYEGPSRTNRGGVRHTSLYLWRDETEDALKEEVRSGFMDLNSLAGVDSVVVADNVGTLETDYDFIVDAMVEDEAAANALLASSQYETAVSKAAMASKYEWTARITHTMALG